jgi:hypothetical protein
MREIQLGGPRAKRHGVALMDDADFERLGAFQWCISAGSRPNAPSYAVRRLRLDDGRSVIQRMHHAVTGLRFVDHIDGNGLNNQRANLRSATAVTNARNGKAHRDSASRYRGVSWFRRDGLWRAQISTGRNRHIGYFETERAAALAYDDAAADLFGEFARLNFPQETNQ